MFVSIHLVLGSATGRGASAGASFQMLGITIPADLRGTSYFEEVPASSYGSSHALRIHKSHGLSPGTLHVVVNATTVSRLMYAEPACWGLISAEIDLRLKDFV